MSGRKTAEAQAPKVHEPTLRVHLWLETPEGMLFGLGRTQLLRKVEELGSLNQAAKDLGMSYRAAWGRIKRTEEMLGEPLVQKAHGHKGYVLTPLGRELVRDFARWHEDVEAFALRRARELLPWKVRTFSGEEA